MVLSLAPKVFQPWQVALFKAGFLVGTEEGGGGTGEEKRKESFSVLLFTPDLPTLLGVRCALTGRGVGGGGEVEIDFSPKPVISSQFHFSTIPENSLVK